MCSDLIFNLLKIVTDDSFIFMQNISFSFSTFLNLSAEISRHKNRYTNLKSPDIASK